MKLNNSMLLLEEKFDISKFEKINEDLKSFLSNYQKNNTFDFKLFQELHKRFVGLIIGYVIYEDLLFRLQDSYNKIENGELNNLIIGPDSYHTLLWKIHQRSMMKENNIKDFEPSIQNFFKSLKVKEKHIFKTESGVSIHTEMGRGIGHLTIIKIEDNIYLNICDHSPSRITTLKEQLSKLNYNCTDIRELDIWDEKEGNKNYSFEAIKYVFKQEDLDKLLSLLNVQRDIDWFVCEQGEDNREKIEAEIDLLRFCYYLYNNYNIEPKKIINKIKNIIKNISDN